MALINIITNFAAAVGLNPTEDRTTLLSLINRAALELYEQDDLPGSLRECIVTVPANSQITLPSYVGSLRAMRAYNSKDKVELNDMRPRYNYSPWPQEINKWRLKYVSPIMRDITNAGLLTLTTQAVETAPVVVTISGSTDASANITESITLNDVSVNTTNAFNDIKAITKVTPSLYDVTVSDLSGNVLAVLNNDKLATHYLVVDVSRYPMCAETEAGRYIELLYKQAFTGFVNDGDSFPCEGFDNAIYYRSMEIWLHGQEGKEDRAVLFAQKCAQVVANVIAQVEGSTQKELTFAPNGYLEINKPPFNYHNRY